MTKMYELLDDLRHRRAAARAMGGEERIARQHGKGKLTARERVNHLLDPGSFQEYGLLASHAGQKPGDPITPADGVIAGVGRVEGRPVCLFAEDATVFGGSVGEVNGLKRVRMIEIASRERIPFLCLLDGAGFRAQNMADESEGAPAVGHTLAFARHSASAPTMALVMGPCAGEPALEAAMMSFSIMVKGVGMLAAGGPPVVKASTGLEITKEELGGAKVHAEITGMVDNAVGDDMQAIAAARKVLSYLPTNAWAYPPSVSSIAEKGGVSDDILSILPDSARAPYDMHRVIDHIVDEYSFFETKPDYGQALLTGFARLNGHSIGLLASQPMVRAGALSAAEAQKARKFIELCGAYHLPIVSLVDTPGVMTGREAEREGSLKFGLAAAFALAWANVPVFSVILRKAFGFGGALMGGHGGGQTITLVWPTVDFSSLPPDSAVEALHAKELSASDDPDALRKVFLKKYSAFGGPYPAAGVMNIDDVIDPRETRSRLIHALELSMARRTAAPEPNCKYGVMP